MDVVEWCARQAVAHHGGAQSRRGLPQEALAELIRSTAENYTLLRKLMNSQRHEQIQRILGEARAAPIWRSWRGAGPRPSGPSTATPDIALDFLTFGLVGILLKHCGEPDLDPDRLAEQMIRILGAKLGPLDEA